MIRHAKVKYSGPFFTTVDLFDEAGKAYNAAAVEPVNLKISKDEFPLCYVSSLPRAVETATMIYEGRFIITNELVEVKNVSLFFRSAKFPSILRAIAGRVAWLFNYSKMSETKKKPTQGQRNLSTVLTPKKQKNTLLVTHGFFMHCLRRELKKQGFKGRIALFPKNAVFYLFER